jgi:hypothetical protein
VSGAGVGGGHGRHSRGGGSRGPAQPAAGWSDHGLVTADVGSTQRVSAGSAV